MLKTLRFGWALAWVLVGLGACSRPERPNILLFVTDDQSWLHTSHAGDATIQTPAFDRVAREGVHFEHAFVASPLCTPSRSAILTGQEIWRLEEGGRFRETLPVKFEVFPLLLEEAGYRVGWTGKGWGPGDLKRGGWGDRTPTGAEYNQRKVTDPELEQHRIDYAANFESFLAEQTAGEPFFFWCGTVQPHRPYVEGSGVASGKRLEDVVLPEHLPDDERMRSDMLDFAVAVEYADLHLKRILEALEAKGQLENTLILATSDNGVAVPRGKRAHYDLGTRVPLAARWPGEIAPGREVSDFVSLTDLAPTLLEVAGVRVPGAMTGRSLLEVLRSSGSGRVDESRDFVVTATESEQGVRAIRTDDYLYIRNLSPGFQPPGDFLTSFEDHEDYWRCYSLVCRKPAEELYDVRTDFWQIHNVVEEAPYAGALADARLRLERYLAATAP